MNIRSETTDFGSGRPGFGASPGRGVCSEISGGPLRFAIPDPFTARARILFSSLDGFPKPRASWDAVFAARDGRQFHDLRPRTATLRFQFQSVDRNSHTT